MNTIFPLVGKSGAGKSTLIFEVVKRCDKVEIIKSTTTREKRNEMDDFFYHFVSKKEFIRQHFVEKVQYAMDFYGFKTEDVLKITNRNHGICAMTEEGVIAFQKLGYKIKPVKIESDNLIKPSQIRITEDKRRAKIQINYEKIIHNSFEEGGKEKAVQELIDFINSCA